MKNKDFDKKLKKDLLNYESELDVDSFWGSIESDVDAINRKDKRRRVLPFLWFFLFAGIAASILLSVCFVEGQDKLEITNSRKGLDLNSKYEINNENEISSLKNKVSETKTIQNDFGKKDGLDKLKELSESSFFSKTKINSISVTSNDSINESFIKIEEEKNQNEFILISKEEVKIKSLIRSKESILKLTGRYFLIENQYSKLPFSETEKQIDFLIKNEKLDSTKIEILPKNPKKFFIELLAGLHYVNRLLENRSQDNQALLNLRDQTESMRGAFNFSVLGSWKPKPFFSFSTGINFTQINERFQFQGEIVKTVSIENDIIAYQININEDSVAIFGNQILDERWSHNKLYYNKYRMFDIPILVGFEKQKNNFSIGIRTGLFVNLKLKTSGLIFQTPKTFLSLDSNQDELYKSNVQLSYYLGGMIKYHLNNRIAISASPSFRVFPKSFIKSGISVTQKYNLMGLNLGLEYGF